MRILNLGCGTKTSDFPHVLNVDWSIHLRIRRNPLLRKVGPALVGPSRRKAFNKLPGNVVVHNLKKGIPFPSDCVDAVFHSHFLEHLDRDVAPRFMREVLRVLKPGGIHRIAVPDLERACRAYIASLDATLAGDAGWKEHDERVAALVEQSVRREAFGTSTQPTFRRWLENRLLGDARARGETHQWMYDRVNLLGLLQATGHEYPQTRGHGVSAIPGWAEIGLEVTDDGREYKPGSLYVEARKPNVPRTSQGRR